MRITRRQLRRLIRESLDLVTEASDPSQLSDQEKDKLIADINWKTCNLPDDAAWQKYTNRVYGWSKKAKSPEVAKQQFVGAVTVPIYWESLVLTADTWVEKEAALLETRDWWHYSSGYASYVKFYEKEAGGRDIHSKEFNKLFLDTFMAAYKEGMTSGHSQAAKKRATPAALSALRKDMETYLDKQIQAYIDEACIPPEFSAWFKKGQTGAPLTIQPDNPNTGKEKDAPYNEQDFWNRKNNTAG